MIRKMQLSMLLVCLMVVSILSACGSNNEASKSDKIVESPSGSTSNMAVETEAPPEPVTLNYSTFDNVDPGSVNSDMAKAYMEKFPHVTIKLNKVGAKDPNGSDPLMVQIAGGADIDIIDQGNNINLMDMVNKEITLDLGPYIEKNKVDFGPAQQLTEQSKINGKTYALHGRKSWWGLFYNKDLFDQANVTYPTNDTTWEQFREMAVKLTDRSKQVYGTFQDTWTVSTSMLAVQQGKGISNLTLEDPLLQSLTFWKSLWVDDKVIKPWADIVISKTWGVPEFESGKVAMMVTGDWMLSGVNADVKAGKVKMNYDVVAPPHSEGVKAGTTWSMPTSHIVYAKSKHPDEAFKFILFMCNSEAGAKIWAEHNFVPVYSTPESQSIYSNLIGSTPEHLKDFLAMMSSVPEALPLDNVAARQTEWDKQAQLVMLGEKTPEKAFTDFKAAVK
ncbi:MAG: sugar ABC transporter substrate-binding protein [Gorillibacterium sp.]|nr:sugar ABC transporter substrate-binding protein [Gorillibacterium sp.]